MRIALLWFSLLCAACGGNQASVQAPEPDQGHADPDGGDSGGDVVAPAPAPAIPLGRLDGTQTTFAAERAPVTVVILWASYCAPCLRELPLLEALQREYADRDEVSVLLVSIDEFTPESRAKVADIIAERAVTTPALIDPEQALIERLAPRDSRGTPYLAVPMVVVVDREFGLRREMDVTSSPSGEALVATISPLVEAAVRGEPAPPDEPYEAPFGGGFTQRSITLTVDNIDEERIDAYLADLRQQLATMYPDLHDHQLDDLMVEVERKVRVGGSFRIDIPAGHQKRH